MPSIGSITGVGVTRGACKKSIFCRGTEQIDGIFATSDVDVMGARFLPFWSGIGDHRASVIDVPLQSPAKKGFKAKQEIFDYCKKDLMRAAEKKCRKLCMGEVDFSPVVMQWRQRRIAWGVIRRWLQRKVKSRAYVKRVARHAGIHCPLQVTMEEAERGYRIASDEYKRLKPNAPTAPH